MAAVTEFNNLKYLCDVFKCLSIEKKKWVLNTARSLLKIQDDSSCFNMGNENYCGLGEKKAVMHKKMGLE